MTLVDGSKVEQAVDKMRKALVGLCNCGHGSLTVTVNNAHEHLSFCRGRLIYDAMTLVMEAREDGNLTDTILHPVGLVVQNNGQYAIAAVEGVSFSDFEGKTLYGRS